VPNADWFPRIEFGLKEVEQIKSCQGEILGQFLMDYGVPGEVHMPSVWSGIGALAGFSVQHSMRKGGFITNELIDQEDFIVGINTPQGETLFFGNCVNDLLVSTAAGRLSVWSFVASAVAGPNPPPGVLPELQPMFVHVGRTIGTERFGVPNLTPEYMPREMPRAVVMRCWPKAQQLLENAQFHPKSWPVCLGYIASAAMNLATEISLRKLAARIVMEAAIPMSKLDPKSVQ
jgi:hypothetical protein